MLKDDTPRTAASAQRSGRFASPGRSSRTTSTALRRSAPPAKKKKSPLTVVIALLAPALFHDDVHPSRGIIQSTVGAYHDAKPRFI